MTLFFLDKNQREPRKEKKRSMIAEVIDNRIDTFPAEWIRRPELTVAQAKELLRAA